MVEEFCPFRAFGIFHITKKYSRIFAQRSIIFHTNHSQKNMKNLIVCIFFLLIALPTFAQWQKVSGRNSIEHQSASFSKYQSIICSNGEDGLYYTRDNGAQWKFMRPSYFKEKDTINVVQSVVSEAGIFALVKKYSLIKGEPIDSFFVFHTQNFGISWEKRTLPITPLVRSFPSQSHEIMQNKDFVFWYGYGGDYTRINGKYQVLRYSKKQKIWENVSAQYKSWPSKIRLTDIAEYTSNYTEDTLNIRYMNGNLVSKHIPRIQLYPILMDSLIHKESVIAGNRVIVFSKDLGATWYEVPFIDKISYSNPNYKALMAYKNKIFYMYKGSLYVSLDKGKNWSLESDEFKKYTINMNFDIPIFQQDSVLLFNYRELSTFVLGYNFNTKKISFHNPTDLVNHIDELKGISQLPDGKLIARFLDSQQFTLISNDKGANWQFNKEGYPYYFDKIPINDTTFYVRRYDENALRFVNGKLKDTINFFSIYDLSLRSGDTIVSFNNRKQQLVYAKSPFIDWVTIPNQENKLIKRPPFSFKNNTIFSIVYNSDNGEFIKQLMSIKLDGTTYKYKYIKNADYLDISTPQNIWFAYQNGSVNTLANSVDSLKTWKNIFANPQNNIDFSSLLIVNQKNILTGQILLLNDFSQSPSLLKITRDGGKTWGQFNNGFAKEFFVSKNQQIGDYLFAFTNNGLYRRPLSDINLRSVAGKAFHDLNGNKLQDAKEPPLANIKITSKKTGAFTMTDTSGTYSLLIDVTGADTLTASFDNKSAIINPAFYVLTQSDTAKNFAIQFAPNVQDLKIDLTALTPPRSGFVNNYILTVKNVGSLAKDSKVTLKYSPKQTFVQTNLAPATHANQLLTWNFAGFKPNEIQRIDIQFKTALDAAIRTEIIDIAGIDPIVTDNFKGDNIDTLRQTVVGSFDPNDKQVTFSSTKASLVNSKTPPSVIDQNTELTYTIRFQNTGNYPADFVTIKDTLSDLLDVSTLRLLSGSHEYKANSKGRVVTIDFNPIFLPDSTANEKKSHGFIKFAIKPKRAILPTESIKNTAYIYFDYNPSIITNTVVSKNLISSIFEPIVAETVQIYPNPTHTHITFSINDCTDKAMQARIYSMEGRLLLTKSMENSQQTAIDIATLSAGVYMLRVQSSCKQYVGKFVVE
jgi:uncharacterized repeat protein (TIGR01451 family)